MSPEAASEARIEFRTFQELAPEVVAGLRAIGRSTHDSGLEFDLMELVKLRASQLNGCAYCLQFHLNEARGFGVLASKLDMLSAWRDAGIYSARERAALAWTERLTLLAQQHVSDQAFDELSKEFTVREIAFLTAAIGTINFWNRIAAPFRFAPPTSGSAA